jgi:hypothetical protein
MKISQAAFDLIWQEETGGTAYYKATDECSADYPGGASGVTIGGFYDCGYVSHDELRQDWGGKLPAKMLNALEDVIGITGPPARSHAHELHGTVTVPIDVAHDVFANREIPKWEAIVMRDLPHADQLSADSYGALVSLAMNRGDSFSSPRRAGDALDRYREMRLIRSAMAAQDFKSIPGWLRSMKRLWAKDGDLYKRREHEAALFEKGLSVPT